MNRPPPKDPRQWAIAAVLLLTAVLAVTPFLDQRALQNYDNLFQRAVVTFALARTLNGVISAVQGTEVALQPAGVGVTLTPGQMLDPVNDLVERFSWIMLGATVSLGVQNVLLEISAFWLLQGLVVLLAGWLVFLYLSGRGEGGAQRNWLWKALLVAAFLRFAVPLTLVANEAIYSLFLEARYTESSEIISHAGEELEALGADDVELAEGPPDDTGFFEGMVDAVSQTLGSASEGVSLGEKVDAIQARAADMIEHLIQLSVVFVLQTGVLPVAFLWLFLQLGKWVFRPRS